MAVTLVVNEHTGALSPEPINYPEAVPVRSETAAGKGPPALRILAREATCVRGFFELPCDS